MSQSIKIRRGVDVKLKGLAEQVISIHDRPGIFAIKPTDFHNLIPKMEVKEGDQVKVGSVIFSDKHREAIKFTSPVSGEIAEVVRGAKRRILEVRILPDSQSQHVDFGAADPTTLSREAIIEKLLVSGLWPMVRQRPFATIANPQDTPRDIFISAINSAPLSADYNFLCKEQMDVLQIGINAVGKLTKGKVHFNIHADAARSSSFTGLSGVELNRFSGPHPVGNVGVQIHHINPINKGEVVWYFSPLELITIGRLFKEGRYQPERIIALAGSEVKEPKYFRTQIGACVDTLVKGRLTEGDNRVISGNVFTGSNIGESGFLGFYDSEITVIPEGREPQFFITEGWLSPGFKKFSISRTFPAWLTPSKRYRLNTNMNGEERAFVMTGELDRVFPFDIYPLQLIKSIMVGDVEKMEQLGIYEVDAEDFALCEFVCTSKIEIQEIVRDGLDLIQKEFA